LKKSDFHYDLPTELIARQPLSERSASRLLVVDPVVHSFADRHFGDLLNTCAQAICSFQRHARAAGAPVRAQGNRRGGRNPDRARARRTMRAQLGVSKKRSPAAASCSTMAVVTVLGREGEFFHVAFRWRRTAREGAGAPRPHAIAALHRATPTPVTWSAIRPSTHAHRALLRRLLPACFDAPLLERLKPLASISAMSRCTSAQAHSSRCAASASRNM
jgi:hypothetical protein